MTRRIPALTLAALLFAPIGATAQAPPEPASPAPAAAPTSPRTVLDTQEVEILTEAEELEQSSEAVQVVDTEDARREAAPLAEVLARSNGVGVRRAGGLGSRADLSLAGLSGDQVRVLVDGVPIDVAGYPFGFGNVPTGLIERVDIYRGVVPIRFGADALGGAANLITAEPDGTSGTLSLQIGSFDTVRTLGGFSTEHLPTGLYIRGSAFYDAAENDYPIDVEVPDERGRLSDERVDRFHDGYRAGGGELAVGLRAVSWADRVELRLHGAAFSKELQHNTIMTVPYGEPITGGFSHGATLRWQHTVDTVAFDALAAYSQRSNRFVDRGECVYDWFGECARESDPGEVTTRERSALTRSRTVFTRFNAAWSPTLDHTLSLSLTPSSTWQTGEDRLVPTDVPDPQEAERQLTTLVGGLEYTARLVDDRIENTAFGKLYAAWADSHEPNNRVDGPNAHSEFLRGGVGNALRVRLTDTVVAKASYELATRLPRADELFGDGLLVADNLTLRPEFGHNGNLSVALIDQAGSTGVWRGEVNGFVRSVDQLIVLLGNQQFFSYENVLRATSRGVELSAGWTSPGDYLTLGGNATWQDFRNRSSAGPFEPYGGDRIPNRPFFFANASARLGFSDVFTVADRLSASYHFRHVRKFYRSWESAGITSFKQFVPGQLTHAVGVHYRVALPGPTLHVSAELDNLTNAATFDHFGVQRPGRAFYAKVTVDF